MAVFDLPLEELKKYTGRNPKPADFDQYWERALNEMNSTDPRVELVPADFVNPVAECYDLFYTGVKGARIHAKLLKPRDITEPTPAILHFHGYSGNSGDWHNHLAYAASGFTVAAMDCRGQGGLSEDRGGVFGNTLEGHIIRGLDDPNPDNLLFRDIFLDTTMLARIVMDMPFVDKNRVGAMGGSQGGGLTIACAALVPEIKKLAPCYPFLSDYKRVWEMDLAKDAYVELTQYFRNFDPLHLREEEVFTKLGYIDIQHLADRIRGEVLMATALMDTVCPPSSQFAAYNKIKSKKNMIIYPDFGHEYLPKFEDLKYQFMLGL
ncbi:MAG: acetylxylan esterase [Clostridiaceae bacterium]|nr:acetylxylan esterase [Clostridiaceae bacterium]